MLPLQLPRPITLTVLALLIAQSSSSCVQGGIDEFDGEVVAREADASPAQEAVVIYESSVLRGEDGQLIPIFEDGDISPDVAEQVSRPWSFRDQPYVYQEEAWEWSTQDGFVEQRYRVTRVPRESDNLPTIPPAEPEIDPGLLVLASGDVSGEVVTVHMRLRDFPEWNIPPRPSTMLASAIDLEEAASRRAQALESRQELADAMSADLVGFIESSGGTVIGVRGSSGWVWANLPAHALLELFSRTDIEQIRQPDAEITTAAWRQGDGRWPDRMNADTYLASGWDGGTGNPARHSFPRLVAAVIEATNPSPVSGFEDEACAFYDGANCTGTTRILARYKCDLGGVHPCHFVTGFAEAEEGTHGTGVASAVLADFQDNQGCGKELADPGWISGCHTADWENSATGMAPEAYLEYFATWGPGWPGSPQASVADAISFAYIYGEADVINNSFLNLQHMLAGRGAAGARWLRDYSRRRARQ